MAGTKSRFLGDLPHVRESVFCFSHGFFSLLRGCALLVRMGAWNIVVTEKNQFPYSRVSA